MLDNEVEYPLENGKQVQPYEQPTAFIRDVSRDGNKSKPANS